MTLANLISCCGSRAWAQAMFARQPFVDAPALHAAADELWWSLTEDDWLEAFSKHPKIGEKSNAEWSAQEQAGMSEATMSTAEAIAWLNFEYAAKFGFIFIVCATGRNAEEMLQLLRARLKNSREEELCNAASEQAKITHLRLDKL